MRPATIWLLIYLLCIVAGITTAYSLSTRRCVYLVTDGQSQLYCTGQITFSQWPVLLMQTKAPVAPAPPTPPAKAKP